MLEFVILFAFFWWLFSRNKKLKIKKARFFKPSLEQELAELIQATDNSTGIALSMSEEEVESWEAEGDPCEHVVRLMIYE